MAVSTVKLNGTTLMTVNDTTATASDVINKYFYAADGTKTLGTASGGSTPTLITKSITANGTYDAEDDDADGYSSVTVNVSGGGGGEGGNPDDDVVFIDYDGTILHSYSASDFQALTAMPANPSHSGLTAQGWNWSLTDAKAQVTAMGRCIIGQMYVTDDGKTRFYCRFVEGRLSPILGVGTNGTVTVDWGDNSATDTITGSSESAVYTVQHTYASAGDYMITLTPTSGSSISLNGGTYGTGILRKVTTSGSNQNTVYSNAIKKVELGPSVKISDYAFYNCFSLSTISIPASARVTGAYSFQYCYNLSSLTIPSETTTISNYFCYYAYSLKSVSLPKGTGINTSAFYYCYSLSTISLPSTMTTLGSSTFRYCNSLRRITIPPSVTSIPTYMFAYDYSLPSMEIPSGVTTLNTYSFAYCASLVKLTIPTGITNIPANCFAYCYGMTEYHFLRTTPPTLAATSAFSNIQSDCKIYVPKSTNQTVLNAYKSASNWSTYASYMEEEP